MNKGSKIAVTVLLIIVFFIVAAFLLAAGASKTFVGLFAFGLYYGIKAMWKKPKNEPTGTSEIKLNKAKSSQQHNTE